LPHFRVPSLRTALQNHGRRIRVGAFVLSGLAALPASALAADPDLAPPAAAPAAVPVPPPKIPAPPAELEPPPEAATAALEAVPPPAEPVRRVDAPPPPPRVVQSAPSARRSPAAAPASGQWVYTRQYGWVWMPYDPSYTYVPSDGYPAMYIYGPALGWRWVAAPWVFNWGPSPYWGTRGRAYFGWYARPWFTPRPYYREHQPRYYRAPRYRPHAREEVHIHRGGRHGHRR